MVNEQDSPGGSVRTREYICKKMAKNNSKAGSTSFQKDTLGGLTFEPTLILNPRQIGVSSSVKSQSLIDFTKK